MRCALLLRLKSTYRCYVWVCINHISSQACSHAADATIVTLVIQALGGQGIIQAQCKAVIKEYVPQILQVIDTLPVDQVCLPSRQPTARSSTTHLSMMYHSLCHLADPMVWPGLPLGLCFVQICSFLGLCTVSGAKKAAHKAAAELPISGLHRKLLAMVPGRGNDAADSRASNLVLPVHRDPRVEAAHGQLRDDPSSTCQMCEMAVTYVRVRLRLITSPRCCAGQTCAMVFTAPIHFCSKRNLHHHHEPSK